MARKRNVWLTMLLLGGTLLMHGWSVLAGTQPRNDVSTVVRTAAPLFQGERTVTLKHGSLYKTYNGRAQFERLAREAAAEFQLQSGSVERDGNGHWIYRVHSNSADEGRIELFLAALDEHSTYLMIRRADSSDRAESALLEWQHQADEKLKSLGVQPNWNVMVQGDAGRLTDEERSRLWEEIRSGFQAEAVETYTDAGTVSTSFQSPMIQARARSGKLDVQLQAALHRDSESGRYRLTLGTPMITSEY